MEEVLTHSAQIAELRILMDIIEADRRIDHREEALFRQAVSDMGLDLSVMDEVKQLNSLLALAEIHDLSQEQKRAFARLMGRMIIVDKNINYNEVRIYNIVNEFCGINCEFRIEDYPEFLCEDNVVSQDL
jgi:uncharacterized tellurite resistance protein B-like protein